MVILPKISKHRKFLTLDKRPNLFENPSWKINRFLGLKMVSNLV